MRIQQPTCPGINVSPDCVVGVVGDEHGKCVHCSRWIALVHYRDERVLSYHVAVPVEQSRWEARKQRELQNAWVEKQQ